MNLRKILLFLLLAIGIRSQAMEEKASSGNTDIRSQASQEEIDREFEQGLTTYLETSSHIETIEYLIRTFSHGGASIVNGAPANMALTAFEKGIVAPLVLFVEYGLELENHHILRFLELLDTFEYQKFARDSSWFRWPRNPFKEDQSWHTYATDSLKKTRQEEAVFWLILQGIINRSNISELFGEIMKRCAPGSAKVEHWRTIFKMLLSSGCAFDLETISSYLDSAGVSSLDVLTSILQDSPLIIDLLLKKEEAVMTTVSLADAHDVPCLNFLLEVAATQGCEKLISYILESELFLEHVAIRRAMVAAANAGRITIFKQLLQQLRNKDRTEEDDDDEEEEEENDNDEYALRIAFLGSSAQGHAQLVITHFVTEKDSSQPQLSYNFLYDRAAHTAMIKAARSGYAAIVRLLLNVNGGLTPALLPVYKEQIIRAASLHGHVEYVRDLITTECADVYNASTVQLLNSLLRNPFLSKEKRESYEHIVRLLVETMSRNDAQSETVRIAAEQLYMEDYYKRLYNLSRIADFDCIIGGERTPLHLADHESIYSLASDPRLQLNSLKHLLKAGFRSLIPSPDNSTYLLELMALFEEGIIFAQNPIDRLSRQFKENFAQYEHIPDMRWPRGPFRSTFQNMYDFFRWFMEHGVRLRGNAVERIAIQSMHFCEQGFKEMITHTMSELYSLTNLPDHKKTDDSVKKKIDEIIQKAPPLLKALVLEQDQKLALQELKALKVKNDPYYLDFLRIALLLATTRGLTETVEFILDNNSKDTIAPFLDAALEFAGYTNNIEIFKLLAHHAQFERLEHRQALASAFLVAAAHGYYKLLEHIIAEHPLERLTIEDEHEIKYESMIAPDRAINSLATVRALRQGKLRCAKTLLDLVSAQTILPLEAEIGKMEQDKPEQKEQGEKLSLKLTEEYQKMALVLEKMLEIAAIQNDREKLLFLLDFINSGQYYRYVNFTNTLDILRSRVRQVPAAKPEHEQLCLLGTMIRSSRNSRVIQPGHFQQDKTELVAPITSLPAEVLLMIISLVYRLPAATHKF